MNLNPPILAPAPGSAPEPGIMAAWGRRLTLGWTDLSDTVQWSLLGIFHRRTPSFLLLTNVLVALLVVLLDPQPLINAELFWLISVGVVSLLSAIARNLFQRSLKVGERDLTWAYRFSAITAVNGILWGGGFFLFYSNENLAQAVFMSFVIMALSAVYMVARASLPMAVMAFALFSLSGMGGALFLHGPQPHALPYALCVFLYLLMVIWLTRSSFQNLVENLSLARDNQQLVEQLAEQGAYLLGLVERSSDVIMTVDEQGKIVFVSGGSVRILGHKPEELVGKTLGFGLVGDKFKECKQLIAQALTGSSPELVREYQWDHPDQRLRNVRMTLASLYDQWPPSSRQPHSKSQVVVTITDLSEETATNIALQLAKTQAENQEKASAEFLAVMSHEIRTPLHGMLALIGMMGENHLNRAQKETVERLQNMGSHLAELLDAVLDLARLDRRQVELENVAFDMAHLVQVAVDLVRPTARQKNLELKLQMSSHFPHFWQGDPRAWRQVIVNLLSNAVKFTDQGLVAIEVAEQVNSKGGHELRVSVRDTGIGIEPEKLETIFIPFAQADAATRRLRGGSGLGLTIAKRLIDLMGGRLEVTSKLHEGSTFAVVVPAVPVAAWLGATSPEPEIAPAHLPILNILVVDDSELNQVVVEQFLKNTPVSVDTAGSGSVAVKKATKFPYDVILMDLRMPDMNGLDAAQAIRQFEQKSGRAPVPIVAMTAGIFEEDRVRAQEAGCNAYMTKPFTRQGLLRLLTGITSSRASNIWRSEQVELPTQPAEMSVEPILKPLLPKAISKLTEELIQMRQLIDQDNFEEAAEIAHKSRGQAGLFSLNHLELQYQQVQLALKAQEHEKARQTLTMIASLLEKISINN